MWTALIKAITGGVWGYVTVGAVAAVIAAGGAVTLTHKIDTAAYEALQLKDAKAATAVAQAQAEAVAAEKDREIAAANDSISQAVAEARAQDALHVKTVTVTKEITRYVHDIPAAVAPADSAPVRVACIPNGLIRVLNAQIGDGLSAIDPAQVTTTGSEPDDACAPVAASDFAAQLVANFALAQQNAEQLNALEAAVSKLAEDANE